MRIFVAVRHSLDPAKVYGALWSGHFYPALRELGHELVESQVDLYPTSRFMDVASGFTAEEIAMRAATTEAILDEVRAAHRERPLDLFLSYFYNSHFDASGFDEIRRLGVPSINFYCNNIHQFDNVAEIARKADVCWYPEKHARSSYERIGANAIWVQMGADPSIYRPMGTTRNASACFVGQAYADRALWMAALVEAGVPVEVYGPGWGADAPASNAGPHGEAPVYLGRRQYRGRSVGGYAKVVREILETDGAVGGTARVARTFLTRRSYQRAAAIVAPHARGAVLPGAPLVKVFNEHEVCLNFSNVFVDRHPGSALIPHVRLRDFEAPMCRTCYLTGYTDEITEFYDVGREVDTYRSPEELVDKTRYYLKTPDAAEQLREAGYRRALGAHTWKHRFTELFTKSGLRA